MDPDPGHFLNNEVQQLINIICNIEQDYVKYMKLPFNPITLLHICLYIFLIVYIFVFISPIMTAVERQQLLSVMSLLLLLIPF